MPYQSRRGRFSAPPQRSRARDRAPPRHPRSAPASNGNEPRLRRSPWGNQRCVDRWRSERPDGVFRKLRKLRASSILPKRSQFIAILWPVIYYMIEPRKGNALELEECYEPPGRNNCVCPALRRILPRNCNNRISRNEQRAPLSATEHGATHRRAKTARRRDHEGVQRRIGRALQSAAPQSRAWTENARPVALSALGNLSPAQAQRIRDSDYRTAVALAGRVVRARAARHQGRAFTGHRRRAQGQQAAGEYAAGRGRG